MAKFLFNDTDIIDLIAKEESPSGGAAVQSFVWIQALIKLGHEVVILKEPTDNRAVKPEWKGLNVALTYDSNRGLKWLRWIYYRFPNIYDLLKKEKPDFLYESNPSWISFYMALMCKKLNIKYIARIPLDTQLDHRYRETHSRSHVFFMNKGLKMADIILCQNDYQIQLVHQKFSEKKTLKIHNPFIFNPHDFQQNSHPTKLYIAWVANFRFQKNLKLLYEIAERLKKEQFRVVGSTSQMTDKESAVYLEKLKKLPNVQIEGFFERKKITGFLRDAKFLLNTSRFEGFSNTFLETMHVGTPILTTHNVNPDKIIGDNHLGILYQDVDDLETQLRELNNKSYNQLSQNCQKYVRENHDYLYLTKKLLATLRELD
jgi:glycosyltransferase involved in cell wall biosynthesis